MAIGSISYFKDDKSEALWLKGKSVQNLKHVQEIQVYPAESYQQYWETTQVWTKHVTWTKNHHKL